MNQLINIIPYSESDKRTHNEGDTDAGKPRQPDEVSCFFLFVAHVELALEQLNEPEYSGGHGQYNDKAGDSSERLEHGP